MKILFFILLSFIYVFGDVDPDALVLPANVGECSAEQAASCNGKVCKIDFDGMKHCVTPAQDTWVVYPSDPTSNNSQSVTLDGYLDNNNPDNTLSKQDKFTRIFGDMDVIGASVIMPRVLGYNFDPKSSAAGGDPLVETSQIVEKTYVNEESSLAGRRFKNSSRATFKFENKSEFERNNIDGKKIKYARLYWGGAIYGERTAEYQLLKNLFEDIFGYSSVKFKTPKGIYTVKADYNDIKWESSFTSYNKNSVPRDTYYPYCYHKDHPNDKTYANWCGDPSGNYKDAVHYNTADPNKTAQRSNLGARSGASYFVYQASADVTKLVQDSLGKTDAERTFAVGNIASTIFKLSRNYNYNVTISNETRTLTLSYGAVLYGDGGWIYSYVPSQFGGWSLVIVYDFGEKVGEDKHIKPRDVNIYSGMANISPNVERNKVLESAQRTEINLKFEDFFTPSAGTIDSSLAFMGFGGRKEITGEDITIKKKDGTFQSLISGANPSDPNSVGNPRNNQFNSSITRFGKLADVNKKYNAMMDLDIFDISNFMSHRQSEVDVKFKVKAEKIGDNIQGDRINLGMAGFSTILYDPEVCYEEKIYVSRDGNKSKFPEELESNVTTTIKPGMLLKVLTKIKNKGNEDANKSVIKVKFDPKFMTYLDNTSCIEFWKTASPDVSIMRRCPMDDSGNTYYSKKLSDQSLRFNVGDNASTTEGGNLKKLYGNSTDIRFIGTAKTEYHKIDYIAEYESTIAGKTIKYKGRINECRPKDYKLSIVNEGENNFYPRSKADDAGPNFKNRLFTKIANKPFDITISNYDKTSGALKAPDSNTDVTLKLVTDCSSNNSVIHEETYNFTTATHTLTKSVTVPIPYPALHVKLSYLNKLTNLIDEKCEDFDTFAVRPAKFDIYDSPNGPMIGGKSHTDFIIGAYDAEGNLTKGFISTASSDIKAGDGAQLLPKVFAGCTLPADLSDKDSRENKFEISFNNPNKAIGVITNISTNKVGLSFSDIGDTNFYAMDSVYTSVDQDTDHGDDCVKSYSRDSRKNRNNPLDLYNNDLSIDPNNPSHDPDGMGRIGCNIVFEEQHNQLNFIPEYLDVSDFEIISSDFSYISNEETLWSPTLKFKVKAMLSNENPRASGDNTAHLYKSGCYASNAVFNIKVGNIIPNYIDNNGSKLSNDEDGVKKLNSEILFFGTTDQNAIVQKLKASPHDGGYMVKKEAFRSDGTAEVYLKFNFKREKNVAKNPFEVTSDIFTFTKLAEDENSINKTKGSQYLKPSRKTSAKFYYARTYAPYYEGPNTGFKAKIYYGVYCNGCDESKFMLQKPGSSARWEEFAGTHSWYVNPLHDASYGNVDSYTFSNHTTRDTAKETALSDGISYIYVKNDRAVTDIAKMHTKNWLIYNEFDKDAATNDFTLKFLVPNGDWAGKTLKSGSGKGDVGNVIGGENNFNDLSDKTNRRISW